MVIEIESVVWYYGYGVNGGLNQLLTNNNLQSLQPFIANINNT